MSKMTDITVAVLERMYNLGIEDSYVVVPASGISYNNIIDYWSALKSADTLKYRWSDMEDPTAESVTAYCHSVDHVYFLIDPSTMYLVAEFALCNFTGKSAQVHFSMHPINTTDLNIFLANSVTDQVLYNWKDTVDMEKNFLDSIYGLTPVKNRVACMFIRKAGFKPIGTLVSGTKYLNEVDDALLTVKTRTN